MSEQRLPAEWLARANRMATIAALLSATTHEVNNALQVISGSAEMLTPDAEPPIIARRRDAISTQALRASTLLAELSAFARDDTPEGAHADLSQIAQKALMLRQHTLSRLRIESAIQQQAPTLPIAASSRAVLQIVLNLLLNGERVLAGRDGARMTVTTGVRARRAELVVDDNGPGVGSATLFQPSIVDAPSALGIGLAVGRWLAERNGGTLDHTPSSLGGAAFTLSFPVG